MAESVDAFVNLSEFASFATTTTSAAATEESKSPIPNDSSVSVDAPERVLTLSGPSHQYDLYKQQTGIVSGALATTHDVNQNTAHVASYSSAFDLSTDFDFGTDPALDGDLGLDFDSPAADPAMFLADATLDPGSLATTGSPHTLPSPSVATPLSHPYMRVWPGIHQQTAMAKADAEQKHKQLKQQAEQQLRLQLQEQHQQHSLQGQQQPRPKPLRPAADPAVDRKISQLLATMRSHPSLADASGQMPLLQMQRPRKEEDDMDDDERLLASEAGKKLTSKERRQLRNKVSARAFRSRRKEYIGQLEAEIASKVRENGDLRSEIRALRDENERMTDLTRLLLSSPSFSDWLNRITANPSLSGWTRDRASYGDKFGVGRAFSGRFEIDSGIGDAPATAVMSHEAAAL